MPTIPFSHRPGTSLNILEVEESRLIFKDKFNILTENKPNSSYASTTLAANIMLLKG